ncbi:GM25363 [Drosophila sechellia]|uniref:GM25363 n=1 Tax=Drosophila sechellia TaxID=7238 RepID=B4HG49_DROSE|nr:GM25363 [Drosophila sechellia]
MTVHSNETGICLVMNAVSTHLATSSPNTPLPTLRRVRPRRCPRSPVPPPSR